MSEDQPKVRSVLPASLSPSRVSDFMVCPLLYRLRVIDRLPEPPSPAATRGTVIHTVLERLFDLPATERTLTTAVGMVDDAWAATVEDDERLADYIETFDGDPDLMRQEWLTGSDELLERYFALEDPTRLEPAERELLVETVLDTGLVLRGFVDRLDVAANGDMRVVDYKTGRAPSPGFEAKALFQMRFYAFVLGRIHGRLPKLLQLLYLGSGEVVRHEPTAEDAAATERKLEALWAAIMRATQEGDFRPNKSRLCDWCPHQALCPAFGGTPPPWPPIESVATETSAEVPSEDD